MSEPSRPISTDQMAPETLAALRGSIAKWEKVVSAGADGTKWTDCPLCQMFWRGNCMGCPVADRTGQKICKGSPFTEYQDAIDVYGIDAVEVLRPHAQAELDFLKSLLPKEAV